MFSSSFFHISDDDLPASEDVDEEKALQGTYDSISVDLPNEVG